MGLAQRVTMILLCAAASLVQGCLFGAKDLYQQLQHEDPSVRVRAVHRAGRSGDSKSLPYLVDRLSDSEADVRFYAIIALEKLTGKRHGYRYWAPAAEREKAVARWRAWLDERAPGPGSGKAKAGGRR
jgi:hypothetical protein